ncbi:Bcr/CflA family multidrug efflux MFS transporter [Zophobihabitans entericus]|uniref:Bcr/CflA family efflux transporter n=1 Tax=Zophobihabitans entericus TaxID=1635327 RepID=A0A6G9IF80_9GAMM|nr:Bcr/CflA family multidrug efflux MFS transporter [Zophobihabitans entericus]
MLMPLSIDMYLPSMPTIASDYAVSDGMVQLTISYYLLGFAVGQLIYGPLSDSFGRKSIILIGLIVFAFAAAVCALSQSIEQLIMARFFHGLAAASTAVVINALMRDIFKHRDEFSRMMSFVMLISNVAPLLAPILGGIIMLWFNWHAIFYSLSGTAILAFILVLCCIPETLSTARRVSFSLFNILKNFASLFRHRQVLTYMLLGAFSGAGLFSFLSLGPFVYINLYGVAPINFGYYFAVNIFVMIGMNMTNSRLVKKKGAISMLKLGLVIQASMSVILLLVSSLGLGFIPLVLSIAGYIGCIAIVGGNVMAVILDIYPHMAGTAASLTGTFRFTIAGLVGVLLAQLNQTSPEIDLINQIAPAKDYTAQWLMVGSMIICNVLACSFFLLSGKDKGVKA